MSNQLSMVMQKAVVALVEKGWSYRRIARELGIHRETVSRYAMLSKCQEETAKPPENDSSKPAISTAGSVGRKSLCEPFRQKIIDQLDLGLSAQRIWQDLRDDVGFGGSYQSVKRFCVRLLGSSALPFRRLETEPGAEAQVDFCRGAPVVAADGKRRYPHVLRVVLSHSRKGYSEAVWRQSTDDFIHSLENAFSHFGGVPRTLVIDNLKAAVKRADWFDPELCPRVQSFSDFYGVVILPTRVRTPRHKGKVERSVRYVKDNALKGREFSSLESQNRFLLQWEKSVADTRIHGTIRKQVSKVFTEVEFPALQRLPADRFPFFHEGRRSVHKDGHVEVCRSFYSAPPEYVGRRLWVRWDSRLVRMFNDRMEQIAIHTRVEPGRFSTQDKHIAAEKISNVERGAAWLLKQISHIGSYSAGWAEKVVTNRGVQGVRVLMGLLNIAKRHSKGEMEKACEIATSHNAWKLRAIRELLKRSHEKQQEFELMSDHPIIRSLSDYAALVSSSIKKEKKR